MKNKHKRLTLILFILLTSATGLWLILRNFEENIVFFFSPSELEGKTIDKNKTIQVGGLVLHNSIIKHGTSVTFTISDNKSNLTIKFNGLLPNLFREGQGIVAKGKLLNKSHFIAQELLTKHDENYMPKEIYNSLNQNEQRGN
jgi:cytochrome c-type biogenesis protein CcmE